MTELLYQTDSSLREFEAEVIDTVSGGVILNRTAFFPGGAGNLTTSAGWSSLGCGVRFPEWNGARARSSTGWTNLCLTSAAV